MKEKLSKYKTEIVLALMFLGSLIGFAGLEIAFPKQMNSRINISNSGITLCDGSQTESACLKPVPTADLRNVHPF